MLSNTCYVIFPVPGAKYPLKPGHQFPVVKQIERQIRENIHSELALSANYVSVGLDSAFNSVEILLITVRKAN